MRTTDAYALLRSLDRPALETREAALILGASQPAASRTLQTLAAAGLLRRVRHGLWALDPDVPPRVLAHHLTAPHPAYVSGWSALAVHDMIEQIPASTFVVSLDRARKVETAFGRFEIHHVAPELFGGFVGTPEAGYLAGPEKALFDLVYLRANRGGTLRPPEIGLPDEFDRALPYRWLQDVRAPRLRTMVKRGLEQVLESV